MLKPITDGTLSSTVQIALYKHEMEQRLRASEAWLSTTLNSVGDGIIAVDPDGEIVFTNPVAKQLTGWPGAESRGRLLMDVLVLCEESSDQPAKNPIFDLSQGRRGHTPWFRRRVDTPVEVACFENRSTEKRLGAILLVRDIRARRELEARLIQSQNDRQQVIEIVRQAARHIHCTQEDGSGSRAPARNPAASSRTGQVLSRRDHHNKCKRCDSRMEQGAEEGHYGWTETEALGHVIYDFLQTRAAMPAAETNERLVQDGHWEGEVSHVRQDGRRIIVDSRKVLQRDASGTAIGILETNRDITERRFAEEALQKSLDELEAALKEKTVLLKEVHHRVKNNLAVICGLLNMNAGATEIPEAKLALKESQQRVYSIALIHEQLYGTEHLDRINFADYIQQLLRDLNVAFGAAARRISIQVDAEPIEMGVHRAVPCALIFNALLAMVQTCFSGPATAEWRSSHFVSGIRARIFGA